ncbi:MAG TPA: TlpA disulfide reductase family protein [Candidatus Limnocylindrales bacterium]|nr:TlpA disulfide reductase family protein [Candidatus Limnocylindrales bacterium]
MADPAQAAEERARPGRRVGPFSLRQIGVVGLVVVLTAGGLVVLTRPIGPDRPAGIQAPAPSFYAIGTAREGLHVGERAPELTVTQPDGSSAPLLDLDGRPIRLADLRGHPVWINFFATWCPPCQAEVPTIRDLAEADAGRGLRVIGISVQESSPDDVRAYARRYGLTYTIGFDATGSVYNAWRNNGIPTQYLIDADGIIRQVVLGPLVDRAAADAALGAILPPLPSQSGS